MAYKKYLSQKNLVAAYKAAKSYADEVLQWEKENCDAGLDTYGKVWNDVVRVEGNPSIKNFEDYLRGLALNVDFYTVDTVKRVEQWIGSREGYGKVDDYDIDNAYWHILAVVFHDGALKDSGGETLRFSAKL